MQLLTDYAEIGTDIQHSTTSQATSCLLGKVSKAFLFLPTSLLIANTSVHHLSFLPQGTKSETHSSSRLLISFDN